jgi:nitroreductase
MIAWTMPDALELLTTRRSFKAVELAGPPPSATEIDTLLTVASRVPDHGKLAPWRFIVFEGEARRSAGEAIAAAFRTNYPDARPEHIEAERERLVRAPLVIAVVSRACPHVKIPEWERALRRCRRHEPCPRRARARPRGKLDHRMVARGEINFPRRGRHIHTVFAEGF